MGDKFSTKPINLGNIISHSTRQSRNGIKMSCDLLENDTSRKY